MLPQGKHSHCNIWVLLLMSELYLVYSAIWEYYILPFHLFKFGVHTCRAGEPLSSLVSLLLARRLPHGHSSSLLAVSGREQLSVASRAEPRSHGLLISTWTRYCYHEHLPNQVLDEIFVLLSTKICAVRRKLRWMSTLPTTWTWLTSMTRSTCSTKVAACSACWQCKFEIPKYNSLHVCRDRPYLSLELELFCFVWPGEWRPTVILICSVGWLMMVTPVC